MGYSSLVVVESALFSCGARLFPHHYNLSLNPVMWLRIIFVLTMIKIAIQG